MHGNRFRKGGKEIEGEGESKGVKESRMGEEERKNERQGRAREGNGGQGRVRRGRLIENYENTTRLRFYEDGE